MTDITCNLSHLPNSASSNFVMLFSHSDLSDFCDSRYSKNPVLTWSSNIPEFYSKPRHLCQWCFAAILPSVVPFFSCTQFFPLSVSSQQFCSWSQERNILALHVHHQSFWKYLEMISFMLYLFELHAHHRSLTRLLQPYCCKASYLGSQILYSCSLLHTLFLKFNFDYSGLVQ